MILLDFNGIATKEAQYLYQESHVAIHGIDHNAAKSVLINTLLSYKRKFKNISTEMVICCDDKENWRKDIFPQYKANRAKARSKSTIMWKEMYELFDIIRSDVTQYFPWKILRLPRCEADDIIGTLAISYQQPIIVVSSDKDFGQLLKYSNVSLWSPYTGNYVKIANPKNATLEHVLRGDADDGVPNVLSPDTVFITEGVRQTPLTQKRIVECLEQIANGTADEDLRKRYKRNQEMIEFEKIPKYIQESILNAYQGYKMPKNDIFNYLVQNQLVNLLPYVNEF
jgi:hypothetical protein